MLTITNGIIKASADALNAQLSSLQDAATGHEYLWQGDPDIWRGRAPNLFPFVGRLFEKAYTFEGRRYDMGIHGFLRGIEMEERQLSESACEFAAEADGETLKVYPFEFRHTIRYSLEGRTLSAEYRTENLGKGDMWFGVGGHPGFRLPMEEGLSFEDYCIALPAGARPLQCLMSDAVLNTGERVPYPLGEDGLIPLRRELFFNDAIVLCETGGEAALLSKKGSRSVRLSFPDFPYVGFWQAAHKDAPYLCVEPWSVLPGREGVLEDLTTMPGLTRLAPGEEDVRRWSVELL